MRGWIASLSLLAACGGGSSAPDAFSFGEVCEPGGTFDINGRAAVLGTLNVHINASGLVETDTTAELLISLDIVQDGTDITVTANACGITIPDVPIEGQEQPIHFEVPQATVESVAGVMGTGTLSSATDVCADIQTSALTLVIGALLQPVESAPLPTADPDDGSFASCLPTADTTCDLALGSNCACDQEADGKPGATLLASNVPAVDLDEVYVSLRSTFSLAGQVYSSDKVLGTIDASLEQGILGCHKAGGDLCSVSETRTVGVLNPTITQQEGNPSLFRAIRVADDATCADIVAMRDDLFPR